MTVASHLSFVLFGLLYYNALNFADIFSIKPMDKYLKMVYSIKRMCLGKEKRGNNMAGLAQEFERLGCWESATEEENIVIYGMDFEDEKVFVVFTDDAGTTPADETAPLVAACYSDDDCFKWARNWKTLPPGSSYAPSISPALLLCCTL